MTDPVNPTPADPAAAPAPAPAAVAPAPANPDPAAAPVPAAAAPAADPAAAPAAAAGFPDNWRQQLAGDDKSQLTQLERYPTMADYHKAQRELQAKFSSGEYKRDLPKDATPEQTAEWRKERGLHEKAEQFLEKLALPNGMVLGEEDKALALDFATKTGLPGNMDQKQFDATIQWYNELKEAGQQRQTQQDGAYKSTVDEQLRKDWGADYMPNRNIVQNFVASLPEGVYENVLTARTQDGRVLGDTPELMNWLVKTARELNPVSTLVPVGVDAGKHVGNRISEIDAMMRDTTGGGRDKYFASPEIQKEYRDLVTARDTQKKRNG